MTPNTPLPGSRCLFLALLATTAMQACSSSDDAPPPTLPDFFTLEGAATLVQGDQALDCHINYIVELSGETLRSSSFVEYTGNMGGEAGRRILNPDGSGMALIGDAFSNIRARLTFPDTVLIQGVNVPGPPADPPNFWSEIIEFNGRLGPNDLISGDWLCAPFFVEVNGIDDSFLYADGDWFTTPINNP